MPAPIPVDVLVRQVERLAGDLRALPPVVAAQVRPIVAAMFGQRGPVYLVGCGDSFHAATAARMAYHTVGRVPCAAVSARQFLDYDVLELTLRERRSIVIGASASGRTPVVVDALRAARDRGALTVALTGDTHAPAAVAAEHVIGLPLPDLERSPGVRTYQATLLALLLLAAGLGTESLDDMLSEVTPIADEVAATAAQAAVACVDVAEIVAEWQTILVSGAGPSLGTAMFVAAKLVETAGIAAVAQDPEEWWHVERRFRPAGAPLLVLAPPGRAFAQAQAVATAACRWGRPTIAVTGPAGGVPADHVVPVTSDVREELSPLLYHVFAAQLSAHVARCLGRQAFDGDPAGFPGSIDHFRRAAPVVPAAPFD